MCRTHRVSIGEKRSSAAMGTPRESSYSRQTPIVISSKYCLSTERTIEAAGRDDFCDFIAIPRVKDKLVRKPMDTFWGGRLVNDFAPSSSSALGSSFGRNARNAKRDH